MDSMLPTELLLLSQALVLHGSSQLEAVSKSLQPYAAASARPPSLFTPQACLAVLQEMLAAEGLDASRLPELKRPNARIHLKLARKYYMARLAELRNKLSAQEQQIKKLQQEETEISSGTWDAKLTEGYDLITPSEEPAQAIYKHRLSAGTVEAAKSSIESDTAALSSKQADAPVPKEEAASPAKELQFADEVIVVPDSTHDRAASSIEREQTPGSGLQNVPEEDPDFANAKNADDKEEVGNSTKISKRSSVPPASVRPTSTSSSSKPAVPERRSSSRVSRASIANLSEIIPSASASEAGSSTINLSAAPLVQDIASPSRDVIPPSSEGMDVDTQSIPMERDDSRDSTGIGAAGTAATAAGKKIRPARKSSVPPVTAKDANKRKRTTTPQAQTKATSPGPADRSKFKRVKTEEPESSLGTPVESDRTPMSSDASAVRRFRNSAPHLISQMVSSVNSTYFKEPVRPGEAVNYFEIIKRPMDLKTLSQNVRSGKVTTSAEFTRDLALIFANAIMYNGQEHHVGQDALNMWREAQDLLRVLEAAEQRAM